MQESHEPQVDPETSHEIDVWKSGQYPAEEQPFYSVAGRFYELLAGSSGRLDTAELQQEFLDIGNDALTDGIGQVEVMQLLNLAEVRLLLEKQKQHSN